MTQKDPGGDVIEDLEGQRLIDLIEESGSMAVYFCKFYTRYDLEDIHHQIVSQLCLFLFEFFFLLNSNWNWA